MSNFTQIIQACENAGGAGMKAIIKTALAAADADAQALIAAALNPYLVFGVKKYAAPACFSKIDDKQQNFKPFFVLLAELNARELTGNAARAAVTSTLELYNQQTQKYLARVIDKDLDAGFSADTVNTVFKGLVPVFNVMLAEKFDTDEEVRANVPFPCLAEAKYDGERTIAIVTKKQVTYYSRSGKEAKHVDGLFDDDLQAMRKLVGYDLVVDGERYASNFTETMNAKKSDNASAKANLRFYAFFYMSLLAWREQIPVFNMSVVRTELADLLQRAGCTKVQLSKGIIANSAGEAEIFYKAMVKDGFEGLILKQLTAKYEWDRAKTWIKWKPFFDFDGVIYALYEGKKGTRLEGTLGGICIRGTDEQGRPVDANVGSGFSDELRAEIWNNQNKCIGKTATIKYQEISQAKNSATWSLRFPTFEHFRDDK